MEDRGRHVIVETCFNFRDLGGYTATDGRRVRSGVVYRSRSLQWLTAPDQEVLRALGLRTVIDLRSTAEVARTGRYTGRDVAFHHTPFFEEDARPFKPVERSDPEPPPGQIYLAIAIARGDAVAAAIRSIAYGKHAMVFHCAAGRDRTGILAAILLSALGVPDETIGVDYALSNRALGPTLAWAESNAPEVAAEIAALPAWLLRASPEVIWAFLDGLRTRYASIDAYLADIGIGEEFVGTLRGRLLEAQGGPS